MKYRVIQKVAWHRYRIQSEGYASQLWQRMDTPIRKDQTCANCEKQFSADSVCMYKPMFEPSNRKDRLCIACVEGGVS